MTAARWLFALLLYLLLIGPASTEKQTVTHAAFVADFYPAQATSTRYGVLVLGGAEGGIPNELAEAVAALGYPVLALAYFNAPGLPEALEHIPLEYFDAPKNWLIQHAAFSDQGLIIVGWSKGAELALLLAINDSRVKGVIGVSPSSVVWAGIAKDRHKMTGSSWTRRGKPLAYVPFDSSANPKTLLELYSHSLEQKEAVEQATIRVESIAAPVLLMSGSNDTVWPSNRMADAACKRAAARHREGTCIHLNYDDVGHLLDGRFFIGADQAKVQPHPSQKDFAGFLSAIETGASPEKYKGRP
jgi:alpha-beta hydrolase superfamily lysophospholipase